MADTTNRVGGIAYFKVDSTQYKAKGTFSYNLGLPKRSGVAGSDGVHGYKEEPQIAFVEGKITDGYDLDLKAFLELDATTVTLELANGKTIVLREAWNASEGKGESGEGEIDVRFEGMDAEEVK